MTVRPITDVSKGVDRLLDARRACQDVLISSLPGTELYVCMEGVLREMDRGIKVVRAK